MKKIFSYFSTKTYVVGTRKKRLKETILLSTQNVCLNLWIRKYLHFNVLIFCLSKPVAHRVSALFKADLFGLVPSLL